MTQVIAIKTQKCDYKIKNADGTYLFAGTGLNSWFTIDQARKLVKREIGQKIVCHTGLYELPGEVF
jgi:hypothetical protein